MSDGRSAGELGSGFGLEGILEVSFGELLFFSFFLQPKNASVNSELQMPITILGNFSFAEYLLEFEIFQISNSAEISSTCRNVNKYSGRKK